MKNLKHLSTEAETRRLAFVRERALRDEVAVRRMEREEGEAELILHQLTRRCIALSSRQKSRIMALPKEKLDTLGHPSLDSTDTDGMDAWLR